MRKDCPELIWALFWMEEGSRKGLRRLLFKFEVGIVGTRLECHPIPIGSQKGQNRSVIGPYMP